MLDSRRCFIRGPCTRDFARWGERGLVGLVGLVHQHQASAAGDVFLLAGDVGGGITVEGQKGEPEERVLGEYCLRRG